MKLKAIHTYVQAREGFEFNRYVAHNMLLSVLYAQMQYDGIELYTDEKTAKIVKEIARLSQLSSADLNSMYKEMQYTLDYNFEWFYTTFKQLIVNELVDNFAKIINAIKNETVDFDNSIINFSELLKK